MVTTAATSSGGPRPAPSGGRRGRPVRDGLLQTLVPLLAAGLAGVITLAATGWNPLSVYALLAREAFGSATAIQASLGAATPLLFTGLATAVAFRAGAFNIGVEGSFVLGGLAGAALGASLGLPGPLLILVCLLAGAVTGAAWAAPPAMLRARLGVDEVVTTLMFNYVALALASWIVNAFLLAEGGGNSASRPVRAEGELPMLGGSSTVSIGLLIALLVLGLYAFWTRRSTSGFELRLTGTSPLFARAVGVDIRRAILMAMLASGVIAGLGGAVHALGVVHRFTAGFSPGYGFTGIAIALLARSSPLGVLLAALLFGGLASGGATVQLFSDIPLDLVDVLQGTVMIAATMQVLARHRRARGEGA